jgi:hypothetical protein
VSRYTKSAEQIAQAETENQARQVRNQIFHEGEKLGNFTPNMILPDGVTEFWVFLLRGKLTYKSWWVIKVKPDGSFETPETLRGIQQGWPQQVVVRIPQAE